MPTIEGVPYCDGCGAEIVNAPVARGGIIYCCHQCADGERCDCGVFLEEDGRGSQTEEMSSF
jgi:hypothetical protein